MFRATKLRMSTEHIGLARMREGLELVRVGEPQRPEMAAWRYGDQFGRRRRRYYMVAGASAVAVGALVSGGIGLGLFAGGGATFFNLGGQLLNGLRLRRVVARVETPEGKVDVARGQLHRARLERFESELRLTFSTHTRYEGRGWRWWEFQPDFKKSGRTISLGASAALPALGAMLPAVNAGGGSASQVHGAVKLIEETGHPAALLNIAAYSEISRGWTLKKIGLLSSIPVETRLALEMMTHEDAERRALEGELAVLEERWREAEEIAGISDNMFLPASVTEFMTKLRG